MQERNHGGSADGHTPGHEHGGSAHGPSGQGAGGHDPGHDHAAVQPPNAPAPRDHGAHDHQNHDHGHDHRHDHAAGQLSNGPAPAPRDHGGHDSHDHDHDHDHAAGQLSNGSAPAPRDHGAHDRHDHDHGHDHAAGQPSDGSVPVSHDHGTHDRHGHEHDHDHGHGHDHAAGQPSNGSAPTSRDHGAHDHHDHEHDHGHGHGHGHDHAAGQPSDGSAPASHNHGAHDRHGHAHHGHNHGHGHDHGHGHSHSHGLGGHSHAPASFGRAFAIGITLNLAYVAGEAAYGAMAGSLALLSDAGHNLGDVLGIGAAWLASVLGRRRPAGRFTYGWRRSSILSALFNATLLLVVTGGIAWEAIWRLLHPVPVGGTLVMIVAAIGIAVNGATALLFMSGAKDDLNLRGAFLHMLSDALTAAAVVAAGLAITLTGWQRIDPAVSLVVSAVIVVGTWSLLRQAVALALDAVPQGIDADAVAAFLRALPGVTDLHHLHIWGMSTTETALTVHLVRPNLAPDDALLRRAAAELGERFGIGHATFQVEQAADCIDCAVA